MSDKNREGHFPETGGKQNTLRLDEPGFLLYYQTESSVGFYTKKDEIYLKITAEVSR